MSVNELITNSRSVLIITPDEINVDIVASSVALASCLTAEGKDVHIYSAQEKFEKYSDDFSLTDLDISNKVSSNNFVISINKSPEITEVEFIEESHSYQLVIETKNGKLDNSQSAIRKKPAEYDLGILVGVYNTTSAKNYYKALENILTVKKTVALGLDEIDLAVDEKIVKNASSHSEIALGIIKEADLELSKFYATDILAGILWNTGNLATGSNPHTINLVNELVNVDGAHWKVAKSKASSSVSFQLIKQINDKLKKQDDKIFSVIDSAENLSFLTPSLFYEIFDLEDTGLSILILSGSSERYCIVRAKTKEYRALIQEVTGERARCVFGDAICFWTEDTAESLLKQFGINGSVRSTEKNEVEKKSKTEAKLTVEKGSEQKKSKTEKGKEHKMPAASEVKNVEIEKLQKTSEEKFSDHPSVNTSSDFVPKTSNVGAFDPLQKAEIWD